MPESAIRAERFDSSNAASQASYVWEVAGKPVSVQIGLDLVDQLEHEVVENFRSLNSRGSEIGGVLLGSVQSGSPLRVSVQSFELIPCDYSRGPLYRFSEADVERFDRAVQQRTNSGGQRVIGFFRSHTRKGLSLDAEDVAFFSGHFREPHQVALLIRPYASKASSAGFFIWENGSVRGDATYLEFAFRRSELEKSGPGDTATAKTDPTTTPPAPGIPEPAAPKPTVRAQIVPIASRREITISQASPERTSAEIEKPAAAPEPAASEKTPSLHGSPAENKPLTTQRTPLPDRSSLPALPTQKTAVPDKTAVTPKPAAEKPATTEKPSVVEKTAVTEKPSVAEKTIVTEKPPITEKTPAKEKAGVTEKIAQKPVSPDKTLITEKTTITEKMALPTPKPTPELPLPQSKPASADSDEKESQLNPLSLASRGKLMWVAGAAAALLLLLSGVLIYPGIGHKSHRVTPSAGSTGQGLALHVERSSGALLLTWNPNAEAAKSAVRGELAITDGDQHENVNVDLKSGSIVYTPSGADIYFQLTAIGKDSNKVDSETVRVLRTRPSPMPDGSTGVNEKTATATIKPANGGNTPSSPNAAASSNAVGSPVQQVLEIPDNPENKPATAAVPVRPFASPELPSQRLRPTRPTDLPDAPRFTQNDQVAVVLPGSTNLAPPPTPAVAPPAPTQSSGSKIGGQIQQAEVITRVNPDYPMAARQTHVQGAVVVSAMVGTDGKIKSVKAISGPPLLTGAAAAAVKQWVYKPAMLNGTPIESETRIELKFTLDR